MRLVALVCWYDEPAWCLTELVGSLARAGVDHVVACDGAYALFPAARACSPTDQSQALLAAAAGAQIGLTVHRPPDVWFGNEVEKRTCLFALGHLVAEPGDWLWVIDADEIVTEAAGLRDALDRTGLDAGEVVLDQFTADGYQGPLLRRMLFRAQPSGIRVEGNHYTYMTGDGRMLWQGYYKTHPDLVDAETLHFVRVEHRQMNRPAERVERRRRYYRTVKETGAETEAVT